MKALPRFAPIIAILALLILVAIGGSALANNTSTPKVDAETATVQMYSGDPTTGPSGLSSRETIPQETSTSPTPTTPVSAEPAPAAPVPATQVPAQAPGQAPAPVRAQNPAPAPAPQVPLNYQYWDDDDDWDDDDWDDDD